MKFVTSMPGAMCAALVAGGVALAATAADEQVGPWNVTALKNTVPEMRWLEREEPVHVRLYDGGMYRGDVTKVFAWSASPTTIGRSTGPAAVANTWFITVTDERDATVSSSIQFTDPRPADARDD